MISKELKNRFITSFVLILILSLTILSNFFLVYLLIVFGIFSIIEFSNILKKILITNINKFLINLIFIIYVFIFCLFFFYFSLFVQLKIILYCFLICCIFSDIGGLLFGKILKGPKLIKISPNKTISGALGSIFLSSVTLTLLFFYFTDNIQFKIIFLGIVTSVANQFGDLFFSYLKRVAKIKNTGNILPGHGGILDRLDGIFIGLPLGVLTFIIIF